MTTAFEIFQEQNVARRLRFWVQNGALLCNQYVGGLTQDLARGAHPEDAMAWYGGRWFVCETVDRETAALLAAALGGVLVPAPAAQKT